MYIFGVSNVSISKVMRHFSNCFLFKFFNFSFICPKKYIQYTRNKYCNMKKWLLKLYLTKKSVFMENSNCFFGSERLICYPKNIVCYDSIYCIFASALPYDVVTFWIQLLLISSWDIHPKITRSTKSRGINNKKDDMFQIRVFNYLAGKLF